MKPQDGKRKGKGEHAAGEPGILALVRAFSTIVFVARENDGGRYRT